MRILALTRHTERSEVSKVCESKKDNESVFNSESNNSSSDSPKVGELLLIHDSPKQILRAVALSMTIDFDCFGRICDLPRNDGVGRFAKIVANL